MGMSEGRIEQRLVKGVKALGGLCWKFVSPGNNGVPDRIIIFRGQIYFVELKAPGKGLRTLQTHRCMELAKQGANVRTVSTIEEADALIAELQKGEAKEVHTS